MRNSKGQFVKGVRSSFKTEFKKGEHWREPKAHWEYDWLFNEYITKQRSANDIAQQQGCKEANIYHWLRKHNIPRRDMKTIRKNKHWGLRGKANGMFGVTGKDNPNWKGGISPERQKVYATKEWKDAARYVRKRDRNLCQLCGEKSKAKRDSHIHHIKGFDFIESRTDPNNLVLLCRGCHHWAHSRKNTERRFLG
ncbi:hypothetical protein LCGC14_0923760 [marine sediment metagenome]|uniref:HNH nuclease domain-containing protein n=1 Tax=marine sediment metagenome TaxID=412755 RepID=A0A0F9R8Q8_9ZZZZ